MGKQPQGLKVYRWHSDVMHRTLNLGSMRTDPNWSISTGVRICKCAGLSRIIIPTLTGVRIMNADMASYTLAFGFIP